MKAPDFDYECPATLERALSLLAETDADARPLAGGQSLMAMMNFRLAEPDLLVDLGAIHDLAGIADNGDEITIGAMTRYGELERSDLVSDHLPLMKAALPHIAHPAIRNRGTIGGSVALADPAAEMPAVVLALDATIVTVSVSGERRIEADDFFLGLYETALRSDEIIKAVSFPKPPQSARFAFYELARRHGDYAMAGVAVAAESINPFRNARIAFFGVCDRAVRATGSEDALNGHDKADDSALELAVEAVRGLAFSGDLNATADTKRYLAQVVLRRAAGEL
jgi:carbon-monoxide dehydrogenase medium subunit